MEQAILFDYVMRALWGDGDDCPREAVAVAAYVKTHGNINRENAFDVLSVMWPEASLTAFLPGAPENDGSVVGYDVRFPDQSRALVFARSDGIGSEVVLP